MASEAAVEEKLETERQLVLKAQDGDPQAMRPIFEQYAGPLFSTVILPRTGDRATAEDVLRDTFITAIEKIHKFTWTGRSIYAWLRQIAVNKAYDVHRKSKRTQRLAEAFGRESQKQTGADERADAQLIASQERKQNRERIEETMACLNERYRTAIELRLIHELPREECAERLDVSIGTFDVLLHRAVKAFRKHFGSREESDTP